MRRRMSTAMPPSQVFCIAVLLAVVVVAMTFGDAPQWAPHQPHSQRLLQQQQQQEQEQEQQLLSGFPDPRQDDQRHQGGAGDGRQRGLHRFGQQAQQGEALRSRTTLRKEGQVSAGAFLTQSAPGTPAAGARTSAPSGAWAAATGGGGNPPPETGKAGAEAGTGAGGRAEVQAASGGAGGAGGGDGVVSASGGSSSNEGSSGDGSSDMDINMSSNGSSSGGGSGSTAAIEWLHLPKAGTSFGNTLLLWACPELEPRVWVGAEGVNPQLPDSCRARFRVERYSEYKWTPGDHISLEGRSDAELGRVYAVLRSPATRLASGFHFVTNHTRGGAGEREICGFAARTTIAHAAAGAQARMIAGHPVRLRETEQGWWHYFNDTFPPPPPDVQPGEEAAAPALVDAVAEEACRRVRRFAFVGITDAWEATVCLFHAQHGGTPHQSQYQNVRRGDYAAQPGSLKRVDCGDAADERVFACAVEVFRERLGRSPQCAQHLHTVARLL